MTVFTFDDLAVHAYATGSVDAWNRLIDEAIELGRQRDVRMLWLMENKMDYLKLPEFRNSLKSLGGEGWCSNESAAWANQIADRAEGKVPA